MTGWGVGRVLASLAAAAAVLPGTGSRPAPSPPGLDALATRVAQATPALLARYHAPGAAVALVQDGRPAWSGGWGLADRATRAPVTTATVFQAGSISKAVTAWGVMRLVEEHRVDLDRPVESYLAGWRLPPSRFDPREVTVRRLLSHTAGLSVDGYLGVDPARPVPPVEVALARPPDGPGPVRLVRRPGTRFSYSGGGYAVLQLLVERVTGRPFADYMGDEVLLPLGMSSSSFTWSPSLREATARPYATSGRVLPNYLFAAQAAEGLYTTAPDYARFLAAAMTGPEGEPPGRGVLAPSSVSLLLSPAPATFGASGLGRSGRYGFGYIVEHLPGGAPLVWHPGENRGWSSLFVALPSRGRAIVVLSNDNTGVHVAGDLGCLWARSTTGRVPQVCRTVGRVRVVTVLLAAGLAAVALGGLALLLGRLARGDRVWALPPGRRAWRRAVGTVGGALAWFSALHTDLVTRHVPFGDLAPATLLPAPFGAASAVFVAALVLIAAASLVTRPVATPPVRKRRPSSGLLAAVVAALWLALGTDVVTRLVLAVRGVIPLGLAPPGLRWALLAAPVVVAVGLARPTLAGGNRVVG